MKVDIKHVEKSQGLVFKKKFHGVALTVTFNEEEKAIIEKRKIGLDIILERDTPADVDGEKHESRGMMGKIGTAMLKGKDANHFHLTLNKLLKGTDTYWVATPADAKGYEQDLRQRLPVIKDFIMENANAGEGGSFEL